MTTVREIHEFLRTRAPEETAEEWDNVGLLVGDPERAVTAGIVCLDITPAAIREAEKSGAELLVSHHPVIFRPLRALPSGGVPYELAVRRLSAICAHTNLDKATGGVNDTLAARLGLSDIRTAPDGLCRIGQLEQPIDAAEFAAHVAERLGTAVRFSESGRMVRRVAVCGGSGGDCLLQLSQREVIVDAMVTGECRHHEWLEAAERGIMMLEAGHYVTEVPVVDTLTSWLSGQFPDIRWNSFWDQSPYRTVE